MEENNPSKDPKDPSGEGAELEIDIESVKGS
jgi:hypothetical protein